MISTQKPNNTRNAGQQPTRHADTTASYMGVGDKAVDQSTNERLRCRFGFKQSRNEWEDALLPDIFVLRIPVNVHAPFSVFCLLIRLIYNAEMVKCFRVRFLQSAFCEPWRPEGWRLASGGRGSCSRGWRISSARWENE